MCQTIIISSHFFFLQILNCSECRTAIQQIHSDRFNLPDSIKSSLLLHLLTFSEIFQFYKTNKTADSCSQKSEIAKEFRTFAPIS